MTSQLISLIFLFSDFSTSSKGRIYNPPDGPIYYLVLICSWLVVLAVIVLTIKWFLAPGEKSEHHIKRKILNLDHDHIQS